MRSTEVLPEGYREIYKVNLQNDKKPALIVNLTASAIFILMIAVMFVFIWLPNPPERNSGTALRIIVFAVLMFLYIILHELVHGIAMKLCGTKKIKYGFTGMYAFAGSSDYYDKRAYIFIALAPIVLFGIILTAAFFLVPYEWRPVVYLIQVFNISGAAGDAYITWKISRLPSDILIQDCGVEMKVYSKN